MSEDIVIRVDNLWKRYGLPMPELVYKASSWVRSRPSGEEVVSKTPWALREINLEVRRGETLGVIGRNGAGKSTLLKLLAGVSPPTRGKVDIQGQVFPMIELNAGLNWELTGRENVRLLGAIMGLSKVEIDTRMRAIEEFTELEEWFDHPVRTYSSGMLARLGFGVAMNVEADILLVDEVMAVGDIGFQNRCLEKMKEHRENGKTILFVSHALDMVQYLCKRVALLDAGKITSMGDPENIITTFENSIYSRETKHIFTETPTGSEYKTDQFNILSTAIRDAQRNQSFSLDPNEGFTIEFNCDSKIAAKDLIFAFTIFNQRREACIWEYIEGKDIPGSEVKNTFWLTIKFPPLPMSGGNYLVTFKVRRKSSFETLYHNRSAIKFSVMAAARERGILSVPVRWECRGNV